MVDDNANLDPPTSGPQGVSQRVSPATSLTTFPNPFEDEPEPGLLPTFLSKVKSTFSSSIPPAPTTTSGPKQHRPSQVIQSDTGPSIVPAQTEAQQIAEAARKHAQAHAQAQGQGPSAQGPGLAVHSKRGGSQLSIATAPDEPPALPRVSSSAGTGGSSNTPLHPPSHPSSHSLQSVPGAPSSTNSSTNASINSARSAAHLRKHLVPGERHWRPAGASPALVTVSPVTSVTTTVQTSSKTEDGHPTPRTLTSHAAVPSIDVTTAQGKTITHGSLGHAGGGRLRRGSISTIPDSPSSVSLSAMISANAEISQNNYSFVPGFQLPAEDTRSVRSLGFVKRPGSVSKIIRRMRGEGLSKHYWMADEHCKECYDCKSVFTTWRRKHHCRICGQIFCSRCASNIIGARRFGRDGMVRVCNLCLKIMEDYDDDDDRRSINSVVSTLPDRVITPEIAYSASPYAASQLFPRQASESLSSIDEGAPLPRLWGTSSAELPERPFTPDDSSDTSDTENGHLWQNRPGTAAPFRRLQADDNSDEQHSLVPSPSPSPGADGQTRRRVEFPTEALTQIGFPRTDTIETDDGRTLNYADLLSRTRLTSMASMGGLNALLDSDRQDGLWRARSHSFVRPAELLCGPSLSHFYTMLQQAIGRTELSKGDEWHRVLSRLLLRVSTNLRPVVRAGDSIDVRTYVKIKKVPGGKIADSEYVDGIVITKNVAHKAMPRRLVNPRIMVITFPLDYHRVETQFMSLDPILKQERDYLRLLTKRIIDLRPHIVLVERFVSRIALEFLHQANIVVARGVKFSAIHQVARCTHADIIGSMDRLALEPRLGRCADFRVQTFEHDMIPGRRKTYMRFEGTHNGFGGTIILRGGDLGTLRQVKLIADFNALVAYHLKNEAFLYGDEFHMLPPSPSIPDEYKDLLRFLDDYRARETHVKATGLSNDTSDGPTLPPFAKSGNTDEKEHEKETPEWLTVQIAESLEPYLTTILSASAAVRFPPPAPLAKMATLDRKLNAIRLLRSEKEAATILKEETGLVSKPSEKPEDNQADQAVDSSSGRPPTQSTALSAPVTESKRDTPMVPSASEPPVVTVSASPSGSTMPTSLNTVSSTQSMDDQPSVVPLLPTTGATAIPPATSSTTLNSNAAANLATPTPTLPAPATIVPTTPASTPVAASPTAEAPLNPIVASAPVPPVTNTGPGLSAGPGSKVYKKDPYRILLNPDNFVEASTLAFLEHDHSEQVKLWQHYVRRNPGPLVPKNFQGLIYMRSLFRQGHDKPCVEPTRQEINFYQDDDQSLGQLLGSMVGNAAQRCPNKTCEQLMLFHYDVLVHGERRLQIVMEQFMCPLAGHEEHILTWSYCHQCNKSWEPTVIREETWRISWGSYLEHCFYPPATATGLGCNHDAYREHIRYFAHKNMVIRIHNDAIELHEPIRPSIKLMTKVEDKVAIKNQEYESALQKTQAFFDSVLFRLRSFSDDLVDPEKLPRMRQDREGLLTRAVADRDEMVNQLNRMYKQTPPTDVLAINVVLQALQDKVIQWDLDFLEVEKLYMPTEKDLRRMTATHLKRLFDKQDVFAALDKSMTSIAVPEVDEKERRSESEAVDSDAPSAEPSKPSSPALKPPQEGTATPTPYVDSPGIMDGVEPQLEVKPPSSDSATPTATISRASYPLPIAEHTRNYDTDSTISAMPRSSIPKLLTPTDTIDSESDNRSSRHRATPNVADLVKRFQDSVGGQEFDPMLSGETSSVHRTRSAGGTPRRGHHDAEVSDSDIGALPTRPRLRRQRTDQSVLRGREGSRSTMLSDGDRSYAVNASRIPSSSRRGTGSTETSTSRGALSRGVSPQPGGRFRDTHLAAPSPRAVMKSASHEGKPRITGKGKATRKSSEPGSGTISSPAHVRGLPRRVVGSGTRVSSIARHFDKLSREAERDRQKRISLARGKRAGRVGVTKAKVQVFNNVRDAFKDEFDSDSSGADNEEDEGEPSDASVDSTGRQKTRRKSSPSKPRPAVLPILPIEAPPSTEPARPPMDSSPSSHSASSMAAQTNVPVVEGTISGSRKAKGLQIQLAPFDTSAPLPPPTPVPQFPSTDTQDEGVGAGLKKNLSTMSQVSESEMSERGGGERSSILKTLTGLWAFRAGDFTPLEYPLSAAEHMFVDSRVIVRENEPTSIIAFTLSSKQYRDQIRAVANTNAASISKNRRHEPSLLEELVVTGGERPWDIISVDEALEADEPRREVGTHLKYEFEAGSSTISCRIFFAEQFAALRQACQCEDSFVESLARCAKFDASGGKSGSAFLKTKDDRFIVKELSRFEMDAITKFAPAYFEYTSTAFQRRRPMALAKTYGIFKIGYRNAVTGRSMNMNVLVQENLFYGRQFTKIYDLKGSTRNRLIKPTGKLNEVLLDENLMEVCYTAPLYLRDHSKRILRTALWNDTLFLSNLNVMDYSLVVGVDVENHELVVGIVDYIRTFTWDKKVESWVKDFGGGGRGEPTIVTPLQYRKRFRTAMERFYFPSVPDRWTVAGTDEPSIDEAVYAV